MTKLLLVSSTLTYLITLQFPYVYLNIILILVTYDTLYYLVWTYDRDTIIGLIYYLLVTYDLEIIP